MKLFLIDDIDISNLTNLHNFLFQSKTKYKMYSILTV